MNATEFLSQKDNALSGNISQNAHNRLLNILESLDAAVYVADMQTYEILFINRYMRDIFGDCAGKICWQSLQIGQTGPCDFCTNPRLLNPDGTFADVIIWEHKNLKNNRWYSIHDQAIIWSDGRVVKLEIAMDITDRKETDTELRKIAEFLEKRVAERTAELTRINELLEKEIEYRKRAEESLQESETNFRNIIFNNVDGIVLVDKLGIVRFLNPAAKSFFGRKAARMVDDPFDFPVFPGETTEIDIPLEDKTIRKTEMRVVETTWKSEVHYLIVLRDITDRKKIEDDLLWQSKVNAALAELSGSLLSIVSLDDISHQVLEHANRLTESKFGYVAYIDEETGYLISPTLSRDIWDSCLVMNKNVVFKEFKGLWGWVLNNKATLMTNTPGDDPRSTGVPQGHFPIYRFLSAPALIGEKLVGQIAICNAERDYNQRDIYVVERIAQIYALGIQRIRMENELKRAKEIAEAASLSKR